jgi:hypothetical protein
MLKGVDSTDALRETLCTKVRVYADRHRISVDQVLCDYCIETMNTFGKASSTHTV